MSELLEAPELVWTNGMSRSVLEVSLESIPTEFEGQWLNVVRDFIAEWVRRNSFTGEATIWMWEAIGANLIGRHTSTPAPGSSEFIIQFGLPEKFIRDLELTLQTVLDGHAAVTEVLTAQEDERWAPIFHVQDGLVWSEDDPGEWVPWQGRDQVQHEDDAPLAPEELNIDVSIDPRSRTAGTMTHSGSVRRDPAKIQNMMCLVRETFATGAERDRIGAINEMARALGFKRTGSRIRSQLDNALRMAVRRGIIANERGMLCISARTIEHYDRDFLKDQFIASLQGRQWIERDEAIRGLARWIGFSRTGSTIDQVSRSIINGLIREGRLESDGGNLRRV
ncbi:hypothetical protein [Microvirga yunnanensis]|uniref:hypothetical protein n=1 Tax=Microvirga yunnanensis TaxID=2953740 RepID=UPI0021C9D616|nr:hypothetical protein [Microvirga sp. HBU65207]